MNDFITIAQARERYGIARTKMTALIQSGAIPVYDNPRDRRSQLVKPEDVEKALLPPQGTPKKRKSINDVMRETANAQEEQRTAYAQSMMKPTAKREATE